MLVEAIGVTDPDVLRAAVLHDVVEDTDRTLDEVRGRFGERVATLVDWVTKPPRDEGLTREQARAAYLARLRGARSRYGSPAGRRWSPWWSRTKPTASSRADSASAGRRPVHRPRSAGQPSFTAKQRIMTGFYIAGDSEGCYGAYPP